MPRKKTIDADFDDEDNTEQGEAYTWTGASYFEFKLLAYCIKQVIYKIDPNAYEFVAKNRGEFEYDLGKSTSILDEGSVAFQYKKHTYIWNAFSDGSDHTIESNGPIAPVKKLVDKYIQFKNPLRNKNIQVFQKDHSFTCMFKETPNVKFEDVILEQSLKDEIYDNTILQMKNLDMNNGIIMYGEPGSGKSMICQAVIADAVKEGFSTCCVTTSIQFSLFGKFIEKYLAPCVVIFEDIDSFAGSREAGENPQLADFLQLLSGVSDNKNRTIFIATTNHLDQLDKAVSNRPMRFNRKYKFGFASDEQISQLIDLYFGKGKVNEDLKKQCYGMKFTGSHIKELMRTSSIIALKNKKKPEENFQESFDIIKANFNLRTGNRLGF